MRAVPATTCLVAAFAVLAPSRARAVVAGGTFAGPVRPNGATFYWNPAAVAALPPGTWGVLVDALGALIHVEYHRAGIDPNTGQRFIYVGAGKSEANPEAILAYSPSDLNGRAVLFAVIPGPSRPRPGRSAI